MKEIFMDIKGYEGKYQVSNLGNIRNIKTGRIMKQHKTKEGYMRIALCKNNKYKKYYVHRLVLETFKPNSNNELQVNHIDENKENNTLENLEWMTAKENANHGTRTERAAKGHMIPVYCITNNKVYKSATEAARQLNLHSGSVTACCKNKHKTAAGYEFKYYNVKGDE